MTQSYRLLPWLLCALPLLLFRCGGPQVPATDAGAGLPPPNILWLVAEDISPRFAAYGDSLAHTPHLDALARRSTVYERAFTVAGVCAPSRSSLITGMYPTSIGTQHMRQQPSVIPMPGFPAYNAVPPPAVRAFPELLRAAGYWTASYRKLDYQFGKPFTVWDEVSDHPSWRNRPAADRERPFFIYHTFEITHEINIWPDSTKERFFREFGLDTTKLAPDVRRRPPFDPVHAVDPAAVTVPPYLPDTAVTRRHIARLYDNASRMDRQIGTLLAELEADGLADNTIIFFLSDHGDCLPRAKRWIYDSGLHIPLTVYLPERYRRAGRPGEGREGRLVSGVDLAPTVLELAGVDVPAWMQGRSLYANPARDYVFAARDRMDNRYDTRRAVRDHRYKYIHNLRPEVPYSQQITFLEQMPLMRHILDRERAGTLPDRQAYWLRGPKPAAELYDLVTDPYEMRNLATDPAHEAVRTRLHAALDDWRARTDDWGLTPETTQAEAMWPGGVQPVTAEPSFAREGETLRLDCATPGASIAYRIGEDERWHVYTEPLREAAGTVRAKAIRYGYRESEAVLWEQGSEE